MISSHCKEVGFTSFPSSGHSESTGWQTDKSL
jgi:hypothetical protein